MAVRACFGLLLSMAFLASFLAFYGFPCGLSLSLLSMGFLAYVALLAFYGFPLLLSIAFPAFCCFTYFSIAFLTFSGLPYILWRSLLSMSFIGFYCFPCFLLLYMAFLAFYGFPRFLWLSTAF